MAKGLVFSAFFYYLLFCNVGSLYLLSSGLQQGRFVRVVCKRIGKLLPLLNLFVTTFFCYYYKPYLHVGAVEGERLQLSWSFEIKTINISFLNRSLREAGRLKQGVSTFLHLAVFKCRAFIDLVGVDLLGYPDAHRAPSRFKLHYILFSYVYQIRLRITTYWSESSYLLTLTSLYPALEWSEREVWDMYGIRFRSHQDLRRILTDYGFRGFPLRKDFPTVGFKQVKFDEGFASVVYEDLFLMQDEREVGFVNPWSSVSNSVFSNSSITSKLYLSLFEERGVSNLAYTSFVFYYPRGK
jgi:NADH:ubiquinone oxidoreductase subunit C